MEQTMIKTENVSKRFGSFALQDIHFEEMKLPAASGRLYLRTDRGEWCGENHTVKHSGGTL